MNQSTTVEIILKARNDASRELDRLGHSADKASSSIGSSFASIGKSVQYASTVIGAAGVAFVGFGLKTAGSLEAAQQGFKALLGSAEAAQATMDRIKQEAKSTPFELTGLVTGAQALSAITKDGNKAVDTLLDVGKAIATSGKGQAEMDRVIMNLQQVASTGRVTEMDIRQFQGAIPIFNDILKAAGLTTEELKNSENASTLLFDAFKKAGQEGGITAEGFAAQAGTFNQLWSNAKDSLTIFGSEFVKQTGLFDVAKNTFASFSQFITDNQAQLIATGQAIGAGFSAVVGFLQGAVTLISGFFEQSSIVYQFFVTTFLPIFQSLWETIKQAFTDIMLALEPIMPQLQIIAAVFGVVIVGAILLVVATIAKILEIVIKVVSGIIVMFSAAIRTVTALFEGLFLFIMGENDLALASFKEAWEGLKEFFKGLFTALYGIVKPLVEPIIGMINGIIDGINKVRSSAGKDDLSHIELRATGGSVMKGKSYMVGENGPELFTPSLSGRIDAGGSNRKEINIIVQGATFNNGIDIQDLVDEVKRQLGREGELSNLGAI